MGEGFRGERPNESPETARPLTQLEVWEKLVKGENLEKAKLTDLDLSGLKLEGKRLCGADVRGLRLWGETTDEGGKTEEVRTNIEDSDWTDATVGSFGNETFFGRVDAFGAKFGFNETLGSRFARLSAAGKKPSESDSGGYHNFNGTEGNFSMTEWNNVDFGGGTGYEARFSGADLTSAKFTGCSLAEVDLTDCRIDGVRIITPYSLEGLRITVDQVPAIARAIEYPNQDRQRQNFEQELKQKGERKALEEMFGIVVVESEDK